MTKVKKRSQPSRQDNHEDNPVVSVQGKFVQAFGAMQMAMVGRDDEINLLQVALVAQEHVLLVGPPGTGKSQLLNQFMDWLRAGKFSLLMTKFTTPEETCGPVSVKGLTSDEFYRVVQEMLPTVETAFLDEVWKASSAILNTLLQIMNERTYKNGTKGTIRCPLRLLVAASNEWPQDQQELGALFDRFLFRKKVSYVSTQDKWKLIGKAIANDDCRARFTNLISPAEVDQAAVEAKQLPWNLDAKRALKNIVEEIAKEGIQISDRRLMKSVKAARASAYCAGSREVKSEHLEILAHVVWDDPQEQPEKCAKIVSKIANPIGSQVLDLQLQADSVMESAPTMTEKLTKLKEVCESLTKLTSADPGVGSSYLSKVEVRKYLDLLRQANPDRRVLQAAEYVTGMLVRVYKDMTGFRGQEEDE